MNIKRSTLIGTAVAIALLGEQGPAFGQTLEEVVVTGIRFSNEKSLAAKRDATSHVEVISAEDIGKMPDKNVADSLSRITGITTSSASANEGGFDENDRISMRGTNPSLTQTLINGHNVAAGDWFVLNQVGLVGRSVSYTLLPSELVDQVLVHKSSEASLVEGGVAGSVNILTRRPLDFDDAMTFTGSVGTVYADKPDDYDPQLSALFNWKSDNIGLLVQAFSETRHLRRDGVEILGYETIAPGSNIATSNPDLSGVQYPALLGAALFEQKRERTGGLADIQFRASDSLEFDAQFFYSKLDASNYNRNYLLWGSAILAGGGSSAPGQNPGQAPDPGYVVTNGTLTQATFSPVSGRNYAIYDQISRPDESSSASFASLEGRYSASNALTFTGQIGSSKGYGKTPTQDVSETVPGGGMGASYSLNGTSRGPDFSFGATDNSTPFPGGTPVGFGWIFGGQFIDVKDKEDWAKLDAEYALADTGFTALKFGVRINEHKRNSYNAIAQGPTGAGQSTANYPATFSNYPSDFSTFGGDIPDDVWYWTPEQLAEYNCDGCVQRDPVARAYYQFWFSVKEDNSAAYAQADFAGSNWSGNIGVRYVTTKEDVLTYTQTECTNPDAVQGSLFGCFGPIAVDHTYHDLLPSANLKWDLGNDLLARFAISKTMTRADYSALGGFTDLSPPAVPGGVGTGRGGNPDLKPIRSTNFDAGLEWYFAPGSLAAAGIFYMDLDNYVTFASANKTYFTYSTAFPNGTDVDYLLSVPVNAKGRVKGFELTYQQAFGENFGASANYTYADGKQTSLVTTGDDRLVGTSKNTYNLSGYYENAKFSARVTYTYRSAFFSGLDRNTAFSQDEIASLAASLNYTFNDQISFSLDGQNLNNPTLKYFAANRDQPRAFYKNGAQYYLTARFKF